MTVKECLEVLHAKGLYVAHVNKSDEVVWIVGRPYGQFFAVVETFMSLTEVGQWLKGEKA